MRSCDEQINSAQITFYAAIKPTQFMTPAWPTAQLLTNLLCAIRYDSFVPMSKDFRKHILGPVKRNRTGASSPSLREAGEVKRKHEKKARKALTD